MRERPKLAFYTPKTLVREIKISLLVLQDTNLRIAEGASLPKLPVLRANFRNWLWLEADALAWHLNRPGPAVPCPPRVS